MDRLGFAILTFAPIPFAEMGAVARIAETLGYERAYATESLTDALTCTAWIASQTERIVVGSSVALVYCRHPLIAARWWGRQFLLEPMGHVRIANWGFGTAPAPRSQTCAHRDVRTMRRFVAVVLLSALALLLVLGLISASAW
jgi:hypothetical protein